MTDVSLRFAGVRVPCTTSNFGSGYDMLGLALNRYLEAWFEPGIETLNVVRKGSLKDLSEDDGKDFLVLSFTRVLEQNGVIPRGTLTATSDIPIARGLGSSAAAMLAGYDLGRSVLSESRDDDSAFDYVYNQEGHGDEVAPCLYGGLRAVVPGPERPLIIELPLSSALGFAYAAPAIGVSTQKARETLPARVGHDLATRSLGRVTALTVGLAKGNPDLLRIGVEDELHVPYRLPLIPDAQEAIRVAYESGAWAVTISGAGSGLIAMCDPNDADDIADVMREVFINGSSDIGCVGFALMPDQKGLRRLPED
jgi:homoserine kinase